MTNKLTKPKKPKSKRPPLLKDKEKASKVVADNQKLQDFFSKCFSFKK